jgi:ketohexokinase
VAHFLLLGVAALDVVNETEGYPPEDSETRSLARREAPGGNATNTASVLAQAGHRCSLGAVLAPDPEGQRLEALIKARGIDLSVAHRPPQGHSPVSYITLNRANGSRTIVHYRDLVEYPQSAFEAVDLSGFDWVHFEGRNVVETRRMLQRARAMVTDQPVSVEIEKPREGIESLLDLADVVIFSGHYARGLGFEQPMRFLEQLRAEHPRPIFVCTWGTRGAVALDARGERCASPAYPPPVVVDTVGAGDSFNAGLLDALSSGQDLPSALERASRLAGKKCGQIGLEGLIAP